MSISTSLQKVGLKKKGNSSLPQCVCVCVCIYVYIYIYIYSKAEVMNDPVFFVWILPYPRSGAD